MRRCTSLWAALGRRAIARFPPGEGVWNRRVPREQKSPAGVPGRRSKRSGGRVPTPQRGRRLRENANSTCSGDVAPPVASEKRRAEAAGLRRNKRPKRALAVGDGRLPGAGREYCCRLPNYSPGAQFAGEREKPPIRRALFRFRRQRGRQNSRRPKKGPPFAPAVSTGYFADFPTAPAFSSERAT